MTRNRFGYSLAQIIARLALIAAGLLVADAAMSATTPARGSWYATWQAAPQDQQLIAAAEDIGSSLLNLRAPNLLLHRQTIRQFAHLSVGGKAVKIELSNVFGGAPLRIDAARLAQRGTGTGTSIDPASDRPITFAGKSAVVIPAGVSVWSDPVDLAVAADRDLAVSLYIDAPTAVSTVHLTTLQTNYVANGDQTAATSFNALTWPSPITVSGWLTGVDVERDENTRVIVAFGDSITEGFASTTDANRRYPDDLRKRLLAAGRPDIAVTQAGISGNRLLSNFIGPSALSRFDRDVLQRSGVTDVIVLIGINDIGFSGSLGLLDPAQHPSSAQLIDGLRQLAAAAKERGLKIYVSTLTPFEGLTTLINYYRPEGEQQRQAINAWVRGNTDFDGVIDFDQALRDPGRPTRMLPAYSSVDGLHPGDAGYQAMADTIALSLFGAP